ncbi:MAG TPA: class II aldolase/adducin family protein [Alphaproteobacteria bacterium]
MSADGSIAAVSRLPRRMKSHNDPRAALRQDLLYAFHVMDLSGQPSGLGAHITARLPGAETFFFHIHNFGFGEVTPAHIHESDFELNVLSGAGVDINPTLHIHTRIYLARPDITCIVHTHAKHVIALSAAGHNFHVVGQNGGRLFEECVSFDEDDGTALGKEPGEAMARALGPRSAMMLKNHGLLTAGTTIAEAVLMAITMDEEAEIQLLALGATGRLSLPSREGSLRCKQYVRSELMTQRGWAYFLRKIERQRPEVFEM